MNYHLTSKKTYQLTNQEINKICIFKDTNWKFGVKSQKKWFKNNVKKEDIHNILLFNKIIVGYTLLRKRKCVILNSKKKYILFDTLIIKKRFRKKNLTNYLMNFNNEIIKLNNTFSFLVCKNEMVKFYKKFNWTKLNKFFFRINDHETTSNGMIFNYKRLKTSKKIKFQFWVSR